MEKPLWTVMIYLSGDNNLSQQMVLALKELQPLPPNDKVKIVAQFDPSGLGIPTRRYDFGNFQPGRLEDGNLDRFAVKDPIALGDTNTGNPEALSDFIKWAHDRYRDSENIFLILSGHGSGAEGDFLLKDDDSGDSLTIDELQWALCNAKVPIRILGLDNCLMSNVEVVDAISRHHCSKNDKYPSCNGNGHVDFVVASEGFTPTQGWPYHRFLGALIANPAAYSTPDAVLELVVDGYGRFYSDYDFAAGESTDIAAVEVKQIASVREKLKALAGALTTGLDGRDPVVVRQLLLAHWYSQTYKFGQYVDLRDFCEQLRDGAAATAEMLRDDAGKPLSAPTLRAIPALCEEVIVAVKACVIRACCTGPRFQYSFGLSLYFPWAVVHQNYERLSMPRESGWYGFLLKYIKETRRKDRHDEGLYAMPPTLHVPADQQGHAQKVFKKRKRPDLGVSIGLGFLQAPEIPSSYAFRRNAERGFASSRHGDLRFQSGVSDLQPVTQWIQNPPTGSGATCYVRGIADDSSLKRDDTPDVSQEKGP